MSRYTIYYKLDGEYVPTIECDQLSDVAKHLLSDDDGLSFKVGDNHKDAWVDRERVLLACIFAGRTVA